MPPIQKIQAAQSAGNLQPSPGGIVKDYAKPGDAVTIGFDPAKKLSSYRVTSYVEKPKDDDVTLAVTFAAFYRWNGYPQRVCSRHGERSGEGANSGHTKGRSSRHFSGSDSVIGRRLLLRCTPCTPRGGAAAFASIGIVAPVSPAAVFADDAAAQTLLFLTRAPCTPVSDRRKPQ